MVDAKGDAKRYTHTKYANLRYSNARPKALRGYNVSSRYLGTQRVPEGTEGEGDSHPSVCINRRRKGRANKKEG